MWSYILILAIFGKIAQGTAVNRCDEGEQPYRVDFEGCRDNTPENPCQLTNSIVFEMEFTVPHYLAKITPKLTYTVDGIDISPILTQTDACDGISLNPCPLIDHDAAIYSFNGTLDLDSIPAKSVTSLAFSIIDTDLFETALCFQLDCQN